MAKYSRQEKLARRARYRTALINGATVDEARRARDVPSRFWGDIISNPSKPLTTSGVTAEPRKRVAVTTH